MHECCRTRGCTASFSSTATEVNNDNGLSLCLPTAAAAAADDDDDDG